MLDSGSLPHAAGRCMEGWSLSVCLLGQTPALRITVNETGVPAVSAVAELGTGFATCGKESFRNPDGMQDRSVLVFSLDPMPAVWISEKGT